MGAGGTGGGTSQPPWERADGRVAVEQVRVLSDDWYVLRKATFRLRRRDGSWQRQSREAYDRGHGAAIVLHDPARDTVVLTRQFRYPAWSTGHDGWLVEAAAGLLDGADPEGRIRAEAEEETGYRVRDVRPVCAPFMSPGSVTERLHLFIGTYDPGDRVTDGGGLADEGEDIAVVELPLAEALAMTRDGRIADAKTIILLQHLALEAGGLATPATSGSTAAPAAAGSAPGAEVIR